MREEPGKGMAPQEGKTKEHFHLILPGITWLGPAGGRWCSGFGQEVSLCFQPPDLSEDLLLEFPKMLANDDLTSLGFRASATTLSAGQMIRHWWLTT